MTTGLSRSRNSDYRLAGRLGVVGERFEIGEHFRPIDRRVRPAAEHQDADIGIAGDVRDEPRPVVALVAIEVRVGHLGDDDAIVDS